MFTWVKKLFSTEKTTSSQDNYFVSGRGTVQAVVATPQAKAAVAPAPAEVKVKTETKKTAPKKAVTNAAKHTKASLGKLTKADIEKIAKAEFGVDLDRRKTKDDMIKDFLVEQKK
jgi:rRNA maturation endonuclease Nob1